MSMGIEKIKCWPASLVTASATDLKMISLMRAPKVRGANAVSLVGISRWPLSRRFHRIGGRG